MDTLARDINAFLSGDQHWALDAAINAFFASDKSDHWKEQGREPKGAAEGAGGQFTSGPGAGEADKERNLSVRDILYGYGPPPKLRSNRVPQIARSLMTRGVAALKELGVESGRITGPDATTDAMLSRVVGSEIADAIKQKGHAGEWYTSRVEKAMNVAALMYPELERDQYARTAYTAALAVTSQGEVVPSNVRLADQVYRHYREHKRFPEDVAAKEQISMNNNFRKLNALLDEVGEEGTQAFLNRDFTVRELEELGYKAEGELKDTKVKGSAILGAKIGGGFFQNLNGNYDPVTMDLWFMRAWNRLTGNLVGQLNQREFEKTENRFIDALYHTGEYIPETDEGLFQRADEIRREHERDYRKYRADFDSGLRRKHEVTYAAVRYVHALEGVNQAPTSGGQRDWIRSVWDNTKDALKEDGMDLTNADMQALWWYPEKKLYEVMGGQEAEDVNVDYADVLQEVARRNGISETAIARAMGTVANRSRSATGADDEGGSASRRQESQGFTGARRRDLDFDQAINAFFASDERHDIRGGNPKNTGEFSKAGGSGTSTFVSPNVKTGVQFAEAQKLLNSTRQRALSTVSQRIDQRLGLQDTQSSNVIGAWATGAENSLMTLSSGDPQVIRAAAAIKGAITNQLAVLVFQPGEGSHQMASFVMQGDLPDIHDRLLQGGLEYHTLEPTEDGARVHILVMDDDTATAISEVAQGAEIDTVSGNGEFIGTEQQTGTDDEQRADAQRVYRETVDQVARERQGQGPDFRAIWQDADDYWRAETAGAEDAFDRSVTTFFASDRVAKDPVKEGWVGRESDSGEFTAKGTGSTAGFKPLDRSKPLPKHLVGNLPGPIPPAWRDVMYNPDPNGHLLVTGIDTKNRRQPLYKKSFLAENQAVKYARTNELMEAYDAIERKNNQAKRDPARRDAAEALELVMKMGLRPGSTRETGADVQAYGATTLKGSHVRVQPSGYVALNFTGKKGVGLNFGVHDPALRDMLVRRKEEAGGRGRLFPNVSDQKLREHLKSLDPDYQIKDFRTHLGTVTAMDEVAKVRRLPKTMKEYKAAVKKVGETVAKVLGNTATIAVASYIAPQVFEAWRASAGVA